MDSNPQSQNGRMGENTHSSTAMQKGRKSLLWQFSLLLTHTPPFCYTARRSFFIMQIWIDLCWNPFKGSTHLKTGTYEVGLPLMVKSVKNPPAMRETWVWSLGWEDPLEEGMATHSNTHAWENPHGQRSLVGYGPWGCKEMDTTEHNSTSRKFFKPPFSSPASFPTPTSHPKDTQAHQTSSFLTFFWIFLLTFLTQSGIPVPCTSYLANSYIFFGFPKLTWCSNNVLHFPYIMYLLLKLSNYCFPHYLSAPWKKA